MADTSSVDTSSPFIAKNVPLTKTVGASGIQNFSGVISGYDYNAEFTGARFFDNVDRMLSDPACWGAFAFLRLPIIATAWTIEPCGNDDIDAWVEEAVFKRMSPGFYEWLDQALDYLPYGHMVFEKLWDFDKTAGKWYWKSWSQRLPRTILYWDNDTEENLLQIRQWAFKGMQYGEWKIPASKLILLANKRSGSNYRGRSIFRSAFKPYDLKSKYELIQAMSAERHGMGIPAFQVPADAQDTEKQQALEILAHLHAADSVGVVYHEGWKFELLGLSGKPVDLLPSIKHFATEIATQVLEQWTMLGEAEHGSKSTASVQIDPYFLGLTAIVNYIEDVLNPQIVEMVDMNFTGVKEYPTIKCGKMQPGNSQVIASSLKMLAEGGYVFSDPDAISMVREILGLPEATADEIAKTAAAIEQKMIVGEAKGNRSAAEQGLGKAAGSTQALETDLAKKAAFERHSFAVIKNVGDNLNLWRQPQGPEMYVALADIADGHHSASEQLRSTLENGEKPIVKELAEAATVALKAKDTTSLKNINLRKTANLKSRIENVFAGNYRRGRRNVAAELEQQRQGKPINPLIRAREQGHNVVMMAAPNDQNSIDPSDWAYLSSEAEAIANGEGDKLRTAAIRIVNGMIARGATDPKQLFDNLMASIPDNLAGIAADDGAMGFGMGRSFEAGQNTDDIERATRTGILDAKICDHCESQDGQEYDSAEEADADEPLPDGDCAGGPRCRCMYVYTLKGEAPAAPGSATGDQAKEDWVKNHPLG